MNIHIKQTIIGNKPDLYRDYFFLLKDNKELSEDNVFDLEILNYLRDQNTDPSMLNLCPNVKKYLSNYNIILLSSANLICIL